MGSFSFTCCVSGLPIECGDDVRYLLLTENPYLDDSAKCYIHDLWFTRTVPLRAKYNDYGSVDNVESGPAKDIWLQALRYDLVEKPWGDNSCHDVSTSKDMTFEHLLQALWEGRVQVMRDVPHNPEDPKSEGYSPTKKLARELDDDAHKKGVPSRKRIERLIVDAGYTIYDGSGAKDSLIVDEENYGHVRVRPGEFGDNDELLYHLSATALKAGYATMVTRGRNSAAMGNELLIRPLPTVKDYHFFDTTAHDAKPPLRVMQAMIREDVWQALCAITIEGDYWSKSKLVDVQFYRDRVAKSWDFLTRNREDRRKLAEKVNDADVQAALMDNFFDGLMLRGEDPFYGQDVIPFSIGPSFHFRYLNRNADKMTKSQVDSFLSTAAEFAFINHLLGMVRYQWRPSYGNGPQSGEWELHEQFTAAMNNISIKKSEEVAAERVKYEAEMAVYEKKEKIRQARDKKANAKKKTKNTKNKIKTCR